jgi:hypothetical protein
MTPRQNPEETVAPDASGRKGKGSLPWQLLQVALLLALLGLGMYEVDLDAKALAESRARSSLLSAIEGAGPGAPHAGASPEVARLIEAYAKACRECASAATCQDSIRLLLAGGKTSGSKGPCKVGILARWNASARPPADRK